MLIKTELIVFRQEKSLKNLVYKEEEKIPLKNMAGVLQY